MNRRFGYAFRISRINFAVSTACARSTEVGLTGDSTASLNRTAVAVMSSMLPGQSIMMMSRLLSRRSSSIFLLQHAFRYVRHAEAI